jgi:hypothetical protein
MINVIAQRTAKYALQALNRGGRRLPLERCHYFAFGANMEPAVLEKKGIYPRSSVAVMLPDKRLSISSPCEFIGKGFASLDDERGEAVYGVVHDVSWLEGLILDILEWTPFNFHRRVNGVGRTVDGERNIEVFYYVACSPTAGLKTSAGYREMLVRAARKYELPQRYIAHLEALPVGEAFAIDHGFRLSNPALRRWRERELIRLYRAHDELRERLCRVLP